MRVMRGVGSWWMRWRSGLATGRWAVVVAGGCLFAGAGGEAHAQPGLMDGWDAVSVSGDERSPLRSWSFAPAQQGFSAATTVGWQRAWAVGEDEARYADWEVEQWRLQRALSGQLLLAESRALPTSDETRTVTVDRRRGSLTIKYLQSFQLDELPWATWEDTGSFETGGQVIGAEPFPFRIDFSPQAGRGTGYRGIGPNLYQTVLFWNFVDDGAKLVQ